ncbi:MAG: hypothetical protein AAFN93_11305 [Bacteroidota bacterium]
MSWFHKRNTAYSAKDILSQLDRCAKEFTFPMLDNGYVYPVDSRLTTYRDENRWAIIIEVVGFNYRGGGHNGIDNCLHVFGNCLDFPPGTNNDNFIYFTRNSKEGETFDDEYQDHLSPTINSIIVKGKELQVQHDTSFYEDKGIHLEEPPKIFVWEFLRGLLPEHRLDLLASDRELQRRLPRDIPTFIRLDQWYHPDLADGEEPSKNETFIMLAKALEKGDQSKYKPRKRPNNHWSNWPDGGTL